MRKRPIFTKLAAHNSRARLKRQFLDVRVIHHDRLTRQLDEGAFILAANHVCWWDPLVLLWLSHVSSFDGYCLMERNALSNLPFFGALGALPISVGEPTRTMSELRQAANVLNQPRRVLGVFPSGAQRPAHLPLDFKLGIALLSRMAQVPVLPVALRYDFHEGPRAVVHLCFGSAVEPSSREHHAFVERLEDEVKTGLCEVDEHLLSNVTATSLLHKNSVSLNHERLPRGTRLLSSLFARRTNEHSA